MQPFPKTQPNFNTSAVLNAKQTVQNLNKISVETVADFLMNASEEDRIICTGILLRIPTSMVHCWQISKNI